MNKAEFVDKLAEKGKITKKRLRKLLKWFFKPLGKLW